MASIITFTCCRKWNHLNGPDLVKIYIKGESEGQKKSVESADRAIVGQSRQCGASELTRNRESRYSHPLPASSLIVHRF